MDDWFGAATVPAQQVEGAPAGLQGGQNSSSAGNDWFSAATVPAEPIDGPQQATKAAPPPVERSWPGRIGHTAAITGTAAGKGAAAVTPLGLALNAPTMGFDVGAGLLGTPIAYGINKAMGNQNAWEDAKNTSRDAINTFNSNVPTTSSIIDKIGNALTGGNAPQPETTPERYIDSAAQFMGGAKALGQKLLPAALASGVSETAGEQAKGGPFEAAARMGGGMAPYALLRGTKQAGPSTTNPLSPDTTISPKSPTFTVGQPQGNEVAARIAGAASDPKALQQNIATGLKQPQLPGYTPTVGEITNDAGLAQHQNTLHNLNPAPFQKQEAARQTAMASTLDSAANSGNPDSLGQFVMQQMQKEDQPLAANETKITQQVADTKKAAGQKMAGLGQYGEQPDEGATGNTVLDARAVRDQQAAGLYKVLDSVNDEPADHVTVRNTAAQILQDSARAGQRPLGPQVGGLIKDILDDQRPRQDSVEELRGYISQAKEIGREPSVSPTDRARINQLVAGMNEGLQNTVDGLALKSPEFYDKLNDYVKVYHGGNFDVNKPGPTYFAPNKEMASTYVDMANDRFGPGAQVTEHNLQLKKPAPHELVSSEAKNVGIDPEEATPASMFDRNIHGDKVDQLVANLKKKGYDGAVLDDMAYGKQIQDKAHIAFNPKKSLLQDEQSKFGQSEISTLKQANVQYRQNRTLDNLENSGLIDETGNIVPEKMERWLQKPKNQKQIQSMGDWGQKLLDAKNTASKATMLQEQLENYQAARAQHVEERAKTNFGKLAGDNVDPVKVVGKIFRNSTLSSAKEFKELVAKVKRDPDALQALRAAVAEHIKENVAKSSTTEVNGSKVGNVSRGDSLQKFMELHKDALHEVYGNDKILENMKMVAQSIKNKQNYNRLVNIKEQSNTNKNAIQSSGKFYNNMYGKIMEKLSHVAGWAGAVAGHEIAGEHGAIAGLGLGGIAKILTKIHAAGIDNKNALEVAMMLNPEFGQAMLQQYSGAEPTKLAIGRSLSAATKLVPSVATSNQDNRDKTQ